MKLKKWVLLGIIICLFFLDNNTGNLIALASILVILYFEKNLSKMLLNKSFFIFLVIVLSVPIAIEFSVTNILHNTLIVLRGILVIFFIYFLFSDASSDETYEKLKKYFPEELINVITIACNILPLVKDNFAREFTRKKEEQTGIYEFILRLFETFSMVAEDLADKMEKDKKPKVYIISGKVHEGKTTLAYKIARKIMKRDIKVGGILLLGHMEEGRRTAFDALDLKSGRIVPFATTHNIENLNPEEGEIFGKYFFFNSGFEFAKQALALENLTDRHVVFLDEIGKMELNGAGFNQELHQLLGSNIKALIIIIRDKFIDDVLEKFNFTPVSVIRVSDNKPDYKLTRRKVQSVKK